MTFSAVRAPKEPRKFRPGRRVRSMAELSRRLEAGCWHYLTIGSEWQRRPKHHGFLVSMTWRTLAGFVQRGAVREASPTKPTLRRVR